MAVSEASRNTNVGQLCPRAYQLEMLEASLKENIIVAMDTGSGKTQIALLRISAELEFSPSGKVIIWFLAPTVALCEQQYKVISLHLPNIGTKLLVGKDNVDRWSSQDIWDTALSGVRVVVSTHAVLADALTHGFVTMAKLALLIFDEAHSCTRNHPANRIMRDFYHRQKASSGLVNLPKILGLTASPIISKPKDLRTIERNLDSVTKTPCVHRDELLRHVHIPKLLTINYPRDRIDSQTWSPLLKRLISHIEEVDIRLENHKFSLLSQEDIAKLPASAKTMGEFNSHAQDQLKKFSNRALYLQEGLGTWATDYFIAETVHRVTTSMYSQQNRILGWRDEQTIRILDALGQVAISGSTYSMPPRKDNEMSKKFVSLFNLLQDKSSHDFRGIIFVEQRVTAFVLHHLLSVYPPTKSLFNCGTFVGISSNQSRKMELRDLLDPKEQQNTLNDFRDGRKNLLIATSALEEGIDISACNMVICFNKPSNMKSFIQRRGRARQQKSSIILLSPQDDEADLAAVWQRMEADMVAEYMRDDRTLDEVEETIPGGVNESMILENVSTGAQITFENAVAHLNHFCASLPAFPYTSHHPVFIIRKDEATGLFWAQVTLPNLLHPSVRRASALQGWRTRHMASKDAAFQAYVALYNAGLLNDHLLPLWRGDILDEAKSTQNLPSIVRVQQQYNPWYEIAMKWSNLENRYWKRVNIRCPDQGAISVNLILPLHVPSLPWTLLLQKGDAKGEFSVEDSSTAIDTEGYDVHLLRAATALMLQPAQRSGTKSYPDDFVALFAPKRSAKDIQAWIADYSEESFSIHERFEGLTLAGNESQIGNSSRNSSSAAHCQGQHDAESMKNGVGSLTIDGEESAQIQDALKKAQRQRFEHSPTAPGVSSSLIRQLDPTRTTGLHDDAKRFAHFAPYITHRIETMLIGKLMLDTLLPRVRFRKAELIVEAISSPSAKELSSNDRLAFLGDTVLDLIFTHQLFTGHTIWPPGYLAAKKKLVVSNAHLSRMALQIGLDKFILTSPFSDSTWKPPRISDFRSDEAKSTRLVSKKALASAAEALIGAAYLDGQYETALRCAWVILPEIMTNCKGSLFRPAVPIPVCDARNSDQFALLQELIGYKFEKISFLAEAMTHPSFEHDFTTGSYGRLAFLGNAVLKMAIIESLYREKESLSSNEMQLLLSATINSGFLAFICLETCMEEGYDDIQESSHHRFEQVHRTRRISLWGFMRHSHPEIAVERSCFLEKHVETCQRIRKSLASGTVYPWQDLAELGSKSYFSEIVRALFGAVYQDSNGDVQSFLSLAEKLGILPVLRQLRAREVDVLHPKTRLGEMAGDRKVTYAVNYDESQGNTYCCIIQIDGSFLAEARNGTCKDEVIIRAAKLAIEILNTD